MSSKNAPPITSEQFITLLDKMWHVGFCEKRKRQGEQVYVLSVDDINECDDILQGKWQE
jgi:hypothetical protein